MRPHTAPRVRRAALMVAAAALVAGVVIPLSVLTTSSDVRGAELPATVGIVPSTPDDRPVPATSSATPDATTSDPAVATAATDASDAPSATTSASQAPTAPSTTPAGTARPTSATSGTPAAAPATTEAAPAVPPAAPVVSVGDQDVDPVQGAVRLISPMDLGAVGDGVTDDTAALQAAFDRASVGDVVQLPQGRTFAHSRVLTITRPGIVVTGGGTLLATRESASSLTVAASDVTLSGITLTIAPTTRRWDAYEQQRLRLDGATRAVVRDVVVDGSAAAGVYVGGGTSDFLLDRVTVKNTRADGIHITQGSHDGQVVSPVIRNVGDDGVAVVSYRQDGAPCARIQVVSPSVDGSTGGRGLSVVGGTDVDYTGIDVRNTYGAAVYLAAEGNWGTTGVARVRVTGGTVVNANYDTGIDHGSVLVYNGTGDQTVQDITVSGLAVSGYRGTVSRVLGLIADSGSSPGIRNVSLSGISISGDGRPAALVSNQGATTFSVTGVLRNGGPLVRTGGYFR